MQRDGHARNRLHLRHARLSQVRRSRRIAPSSPRSGTSTNRACPPSAASPIPTSSKAPSASKIRALWIIATNPLVSFPNQDVLRQALVEPRLPGRAGRLPSDADHRTRRPRAARRNLGRKGRHLHQLRAPRQQGEQGRRRRPAKRAPISTSSSPSPRSSAAAKSCSRVGPDPEDAFNEWRRVSRGRLCDYSGISYELLAEHRRRAVAAPRRRDSIAPLAPL